MRSGLNVKECPKFELEAVKTSRKQNLLFILQLTVGPQGICCGSAGTGHGSGHPCGRTLADAMVKDRLCLILRIEKSTICLTGTQFSDCCTIVL